MVEFIHLQTDVLDFEMNEDDDPEEVQIIEPSPVPNTTDPETRNTHSPTGMSRQSTSKSPQITQRLSPAAIRLRNPYRNKHKKPRNPAFAKQLRDFLRARPPRDDRQDWPAGPPHAPSRQQEATDKTNDTHSTGNSHPTTNPVSNTANLNANTKQHQESHSTSNTANSVSNTTYQPPDPFVLINDGTQRLTIRWSPDSYEILESDTSGWDKTLTTALHQLFHEHESRTALVRWGEQHTPENNTPLGEITHHRIRQFLSPNISHLKTSKTFIFGLRVCAPDNHLSAWITRPSTREILRGNKMEITLSNSKSSSGNVVTAGYILMKHPTYTQRYFYLLSLRKALPNNTPFFDLAIHRRTPHGEMIPHLVVKCGENHITGLSEILSSYLDGQVRNTALFVASQAVKSMTQEEIGKMFHAHTTFIDSIQRLSLYPKVINIDRERQEKHGSIITNRSTREWARSLKTEHGKSLRCDVENGGTDRRAYLLVATPHLDQAKKELQLYLHAIQNGPQQQHHNPGVSTGQQTHTTEPTRPTEIYIPTPAVMQNLHFLQSLTAADVWKNAPTAIRTAPTKQANHRTEASTRAHTLPHKNPPNSSFPSASPMAHSLFSTNSPSCPTQ